MKTTKYADRQAAYLLRASRASHLPEEQGNYHEVIQEELMQGKSGKESMIRESRMEKFGWHTNKLIRYVAVTD
jgi:hypothetical protein